MSAPGWPAIGQKWPARLASPRPRWRSRGSANRTTDFCPLATPSPRQEGRRRRQDHRGKPPEVVNRPVLVARLGVVMLTIAQVDVLKQAVRSRGSNFSQRVSHTETRTLLAKKLNTFVQLSERELWCLAELQPHPSA